MKKTGIITFHNTINYGAVFQTYALQKYIQKIGYDCEVINYNNDFIKKAHSINPFYSTSIRQFIKKTCYLAPNVIKKNRFNKFIKNHISISKQKYNSKNISESIYLYNNYISGSDQVWNLSLSGEDKNYYLDFCKNSKMKNSYAASIGKADMDNQEKEKVIKLLSTQNHISFREKSSINIFKKYLNNNISSNIDPTFLLSKEEWEKIIENKIDDDYIFVYEVAKTPYLRRFAEFLSKKTGLKIIFVSGNSGKIKNSRKVNTFGPIQFLTYLRSSKYVVTSSFHGLALSLILNKNVFYDYSVGKKSLGCRLSDLGKVLKIENRKIDSDFNKCFNSKIDFDLVNEIIRTEVTKSYNYLKNILEEAKKNE